MNLATAIILIILIIIVVLIIKTMIRDRKVGKSFCSGGCCSCNSSLICQDAKKLYSQYKQNKEE